MDFESKITINALIVVGKVSARRCNFGIEQFTRAYSRAIVVFLFRVVTL